MSTNSFRLASLAVLGLAWSSAGNPALAQEPDVTIMPITGVIQPEPPLPPGAVTATVPQPPRSVLHRESKHPRQPVPIGQPNNRPQPNSPAVQVGDIATQSTLDAGAFRYFQNQIVRPTGATTSPRTPEPASGMNRDTVLQTGNWHASLSRDNGESWDYLSPYSFFPSQSGGFCCDQQVIDDRSRGLVIWLLQYSADSSGNNTVTFAVANGRDDLRSGNASDWRRWNFTAQSFGYGSGKWLDYPDVAIDGSWLYCRINVIGASESVVWRMELADMATGGGLTYQYSTTASLLGWSHRLAKGSGMSRMAFAALRSTTSMYVYTWPTSSTSSITRSTRTTASWVDGGASAPGPDGRDWAGFHNSVGMILGAGGNSTQAVFLWGCSAKTGRPMAYTRIARFNLSDRTLIAEHDMWSTTNACLYSDVMSNSLGHFGGVSAWGGATTYVTCGNWIIDNYDAWPANTIYLQATGNSGPNINRFGDYFTVRRHGIHTDTFVSNGSSQDGGPNNANARHRYTWFGRDDYEPTWVNVTVRSTGMTSSVPITMDVTDLSGRKNGTTTMTRRFAPSQGYVLTAPEVFVNGIQLWVFRNWTYTVSPGGTLYSKPVGERVFDMSSCGNLDDECFANYKLRRTLNVQSVNPSSGVSITVTPDDLSGNGNGTTTFRRYYRDDDRVSLTAPSGVGYNPFRYWRINGVISLGGRTVTVLMDRTRTAEALYYDNVAGTATTFGTGCVGSNRRIPSHYATWPRGQQGPQQASPLYYRLRYARPSTGVAINFGLSRTRWGAFRLPLDLTIIGADGCSLYHDLMTSQSLATNSSGEAVFTMTWPRNVSAIGASVFTSYVILDPGAPRPTPVTFTNALEVVLGGNR